jgi:hypothetical protein
VREGEIIYMLPEASRLKAEQIGLAFLWQKAVILRFGDLKATNEAINLGVLWEFSVLNAKLYTNNIRFRRCFKCQSYINHSAWFCKGLI